MYLTHCLQFCVVGFLHVIVPHNVHYCASSSLSRLTDGDEYEFHSHTLLSPGASSAIQQVLTSYKNGNRLPLMKNVEGGRFMEIFRDNVLSIILFDLKTQEVSRLHRLYSIQEEWVHVGGDNMTLGLVNSSSGDQYEEGLVAPGENLVVKRNLSGWGDWFGAYPQQSAERSLQQGHSTVFCICRPPFTQEQFQLLSRTSNEIEIDLILKKNSNRKGIEQKIRRLSGIVG